MKQFLCFVALVLPLSAQVTITRHDNDHISVAVNGKPFTAFYIGKDVPKPYLFPLRAPDGTVMTRDYPIRNDVPGETRDHPHHTGLWFSHGDVNGYDFWGNAPSEHNPKAGHIVLKKIDKISNGKKSGMIEATFSWDDPQGKALLTETRKMVFYALPNERVIDFDINLKALEKVTFVDTKEGTFAVRLAPWLEEPHRRAPAEPKRTGEMINAQGLHGEPQVWGKRSDWVDYFGNHNGEELGIAILDNPGNPHHPTYWHSRSYGLFAANPFGAREFERDKTKDGSMTVPTGQSLRFRYRVIIHEGNYKTADIAKDYQEYAAGKKPE